MAVRYTFDNIAELAAFFDDKAKEQRELSETVRRKAAQEEASVKAQAFTEAARIIRNTTIAAPAAAEKK